MPVFPRDPAGYMRRPVSDLQIKYPSDIVSIGLVSIGQVVGTTFNAAKYGRCNPFTARGRVTMGVSAKAGKSAIVVFLLYCIKSKKFIQYYFRLGTLASLPTGIRDKAPAMWRYSSHTQICDYSRPLYDQNSSPVSSNCGSYSKR